MVAVLGIARRSSGSTGGRLAVAELASICVYIHVSIREIINYMVLIFVTL